MQNLNIFRIPAAIGMFALIYCSVCKCPAGEPDQAQGSLFLARNAVVKQSIQNMILTGKGHKPPTIVIGREPAGVRQQFENQQIAKAGQVLATFIKKITGIQCPLAESGAATNIAGHKIFLGAGGNTMELFPELRQADAHGFLITLKEADLYIVGASGLGTLYGTWYFLMNYAGLRLVLPGEIGEIYERRPHLEIPNELYVLNPGPDYLLRTWSGEGGFDQTAWLADTESSDRFQYNHNMFRIYNPQKFGQSHPEYYPVFRGKRFIPPSVRYSNAWQPTFSEPAVIQRALEYADETFAWRPDIKSISLTINDGGGDSEIDLELAKAQGKSFSDIYFNYVNAVARELQKRWPDKYVVFLPYAETAQPPSFKLEDNVLMFIFSYQGNPKEVFNAWRGKVSHFGVYQWLYGSTSWVVPNHWPHALRDYLRFVHDNGGIAFKGETYAAWAHDGAKLWVLNNLLWNIDADVDALLKDYFEHAYGKEAAPAVARYFAIAEQVYERRRTPDKFNLCWFPGGTNQFKDYTAEDFENMAHALDEAARDVQGEHNKKRLDMTTRCFRFARSYWQQLCAYRVLQASLISTQTVEEAESQLNAAIGLLIAQEATIEYRDKYIEPLPVYCVGKASGMERYGVDWKIQWWNVDPRLEFGDVDGTIARIVRILTEFKKGEMDSANIAQYWATRAATNPVIKPYADQQRMHLRLDRPPLANLLTNGDFTKPVEPQDAENEKMLKKLKAEHVRWRDSDAYEVSGILCKDWFVYEKRAAGAKVFIDPTVKHADCPAVTAKGVCQQAGVIRDVRIPNNRARYKLSFWYRTTPDVGIIFGNMFYRIKVLPGFSEYAPASKEWKRVEKEFTVNYPEGSPTEFTIVLAMNQAKSDQSQAWFSDVRLDMLAPEGVKSEPEEAK